MSTDTLKTQIPEPLFPRAVKGPDWLLGGRVPSLDGLRAVAISLVIVSHAGGTTNAPFPYSFLFGDFGVQLFFAISGFLITLLLIREQKRYGRISLKQFYFRRAVRILPAFLTYMAFLGLLQLLGVISITGNNWLIALTFTLNLFPSLAWTWELDHTWSLCVEEHFYLLWPPLVAILGSVWSWRIAWLSVITAPIWRWAVKILYPGVFNPLSFTFARMDTIAMGCCLAIALTNDRSGSLCKFGRVRTGAAWTGMCLLIVTARLFSTGRLGEYHLGLLSHTLHGIACTLLLWISVCVPNSWVGRVLNAQPLIWIGVLSYSLYLWQQPFLNRNSSSWMCAWPINLILAMSLATCSYLLVERPLLRWRQRKGSVS